MENYDQRRRHNEEREQSRAEDRGRDRDSWWHGRAEHEDPPRRERGWLDYDRDYGRGERQGGRDEQRYGQRSGGERSTFSPDWSRDDAKPRYSDEPYYSRNRDRGDDEYSRSGRSERRQDDERLWDQRARASIPPEQRELAERSRPGDYYDPEWPYQRGNRVESGRDVQRARGDEQGGHYRGYYSRSATPFSYAGGSGLLYEESLSLRGPYAGRGPKGYKRSDQQIVEDACQRLERDSEIDASEIDVSADDGVIRLRGTVQDRRTKRRAEECVESIYGARDVMNELRVQRSGEQSQGSQASSPQGKQASPQGQRPGAGSSATEQSGDEKRPRH